jgi:hypothetical protein
MNQNFLKLVIISFLLLSISPGLAQTGQWEELKPKHSPPPRAQFGIADIGDDKVIIFGGIGVGSKVFNDTWIFDLKSNDWTEVLTEPKPMGRYDHSLARITPNTVMLFGGENIYNFFNDTWIFNLDSNKWTEKNPSKSPMARYGCAMAQIEENKVVVYSGIDYNLNYKADTWIYDLQMNIWDSVNTSNKQNTAERIGCAMLDNGKIITYGGWTGINVSDKTGIFYIEKKLWNFDFPKRIPPLLFGHSMANINKNKVLLFGGNYNDATASNETWMFSLEGWTWKNVDITNILPTKRSSHGIAKIRENTILLFGGSTNNIKNEGFTNDTWLFTLDGTGIGDNGYNKYESESFKFKIIANNISLIINNPLEMKIVISDILGRELECIDTGILGAGEHSYQIKTNLNYGLYIVSAIYNGNRYTYKYMFSE